MEINVIVAKKGRENHYDIFLHYLNKISVGLNVHLYTTSCEDAIDYSKEDFHSFNNIEVTHSFLPLETFNKSKLLNHSLSIMRSGFDFVCVFDIDMLYCSDFFQKIEIISSVYNYIVSYGKKFSKEQTENLDKNDNVFKMEGTTFKGCSQITFTKEVLEIFKTYFGNELYDETYEVWGGEDSDLSFKSRILDKKDIIKKTSLSNMWFHLWHSESRPDNYKEEDKNSLYFQSSKEKIINRIENYVS